MPDVLVESVEDVWLKSLEDHAIGMLDQTVSTWMSDQGPVDPDAIPITEVQELLPGEVSSVVSDDTVGTASSEQMLVIGFASIHLVNLSTATSR